MFKETFKNLVKHLLAIHVQKAVEYAEDFLKGENKGQEKKKLVIDLIFSKIKFPSWLKGVESKLKDFISTFIDEMIEKAVEKIKTKISAN